MNHAQMITRRYNSTCQYGHKCCAIYHGRGAHRSVARTAIKRSFRKRDRRLALKGET